MANEISVVINTLNEEKDIERALKSVSWASEILVCDMYSTDKTVEIAKRFGAEIVFHKKISFVEPARNFAISKAKNEWILVLDPDEEISADLSIRLQEIASKMKEIDFVRIPRKNIIFNKWMKTSMWWPDFNIRFFKKGKVEWGNKIHIPPKTKGRGLDLTVDEKRAIIHHNYETLNQFLERMLRYTKIQAEELIEEGYEFDWKDLIKKPLGEFLGRFFANKGFEDGLHGLGLSLLQAFSFIIVYLRVWEMKKFKPQALSLSELREVNGELGKEIDFWFKNVNLSKNTFKRFFQKVRNNL